MGKKEGIHSFPTGGFILPSSVPAGAGWRIAISSLQVAAVVTESLGAVHSGVTGVTVALKTSLARAVTAARQCQTLLTIHTNVAHVAAALA